jgi:hypothetical protein
MLLFELQLRELIDRQGRKLFGAKLCACGCGEESGYRKRLSAKGKFLRGHRYRSPFRERFELFLERDKITGCLLWTGGKDKDGYGWFKVYMAGVCNRKERAHLISFLLAGGTLPDEKPWVLHSCDTPSCCEPSHLRAGTHAENQLDMVRKRRGRQSNRGLPYGVLPAGDRFSARLNVNGKRINIGYYQSAEEASFAVRKAQEAQFTYSGVCHVSA